MKTQIDDAGSPGKAHHSFTIKDKVFPFASAATTLAAAILFLDCSAGAGGIVTNCTEADLRSAMAGGGTVSFACDGTIALTSTITNAVNTLLDGTGHEVTISGGNAIRVFYNNTNVILTLRSLAVANGKSVSGAGALNAGGTLNLVAADFRTNVAMRILSDNSIPFGEGGAIFNQGGVVNATNCTFSGNQASLPFWLDPLQYFPTSTARGGAVRNESGLANFRACLFVGNLAYIEPGSVCPICPAYSGENGSGGAIANSGTLDLDLCSFDQNSASGGNARGAGGAGGSASGGAVFNDGTLTINRTIFSGNTLIAGGGSDGPASTYDPGTSGGQGGTANGGAICSLGLLVINGSTLVGNSVLGGTGGAGANGQPIMVIATSGGHGGTGGAANGGALFNSGVATMVNNTIVSNTGSAGYGGRGGGGGTGSRGSGNGGAGGNGGAASGGICDANGQLSLTNSTVAFNAGIGGLAGFGGPGGGGIYHGSPGPPGTNGLGAGGISGAGTWLVNTLLSTNVIGGNCLGTLSDGGDNLSSDLTCAFTKIGSLNNADPKLGPLADYGGPTLTMALLAGSPAIDAGDTAAVPPTDQRGFPRAGLAADIGAFEYGSMLPLLVTSRSGKTGLDLTAYGNAGQFCRLLTSTDLLNWNSIATNQFSSEGTTLFHESCDPSENCRFYRLVMP